MHKKRLLTRLVSGAAVATVTAGSTVLVSGVAGATVPAGSLGSLTAQPAEGDDAALMSSTTSGPCPNDPNDTRADQLLVGPVQPDGTAPDPTAVFPDSNPFPVTRINAPQFSKTQPFVQQFNTTLRDAATQRGKTLQVGEYHLITHCLNSTGLTVFGTFTGGLTFDTPTHYTAINTATPTPTPIVTPTPTPIVTPTPTPTPVVTPTPTPTPIVTPTPTPVVTPTPIVTPTPGPGVKATRTKLHVIHISLPFGLGVFVIPIANVAPFNASGTVQLKDGTTSLSVPVPVAGGFAFGGFFVLPAGSHSLTAVFTPADPGAFQPSTSNPVTFRFRRVE